MSEVGRDPFLDAALGGGDLKPDQSLYLDLKRKNSGTSSNEPTLQREGSASPRSPKTRKGEDDLMFGKLKQVESVEQIKDTSPSPLTNKQSTKHLCPPGLEIPRNESYESFSKYTMLSMKPSKPRLIRNESTLTTA